jgi:perosamine synthetase
MKFRSTPSLHCRDLIPAASGRSWTSLDSARQVFFTYSGRAALYQYFCALRARGINSSRRKVLVPLFHCPTVVDPVIHAGFDVEFYGITANLDVDEEDLLPRLDDTVATVVFIRYFGTGGIPETISRDVRSAGATVLHDCSHSFLSASPGLAGLNADAAVYSFWKLLPSATAGGGLWVADEDVRRELQALPPARTMRTTPLVRTLLTELKDNSIASLRQLAYSRDPDPDAPSPTPASRKSYVEAYPHEQDICESGIPRTAEWILRCADLERVSTARRENYIAFSREIACLRGLQPIREQLDRAAVPWGVPVILHRRYERDYLLRARGVPLFSFGEILHPLAFASNSVPGRLLDVARWLSENLIVFSIHQQIEAVENIMNARKVRAFMLEQ